MPIKKDQIRIIEASLDVNEFNKPKVFINADAICQKLIEIALLNPGTYPSRPEMGLGLVRDHRYTLDDDIPSLSQKYKEQIQTYLPNFGEVDVNMKLVGKELRISIQVDNMVFRLILDQDTKTLSSL